MSGKRKRVRNHYKEDDSLSKRFLKYVSETDDIVSLHTTMNELDEIFVERFGKQNSDWYKKPVQLIEVFLKLREMEEVSSVGFVFDALRIVIQSKQFNINSRDSGIVLDHYYAGGVYKKSYSSFEELKEDLLFIYREGGNRTHDFWEKMGFIDVDW